METKVKDESSVLLVQEKGSTKVQAVKEIDKNGNRLNGQKVG